MKPLGDLGILSVEDEEASLMSALRVCGYLAEPNRAVGLLLTGHVDDTVSITEYKLASDGRTFNVRFIGTVSAEVADATRIVGHIFRQNGCHIAVLDMQLKGLTEDGYGFPELSSKEDYSASEIMPRQPGAVMSLFLYRHFGVRYAIWRTQYAELIDKNPAPQVIATTKDLISVIECPRAYLVNPTDEKFERALLAIRDDVLTRLPEERVEDHITATRLREFQFQLIRDDTVPHGLNSMTQDELRDVASFELIPYHDPPTPFGMWLLSHPDSTGRNLFARIQASEPDSESRTEFIGPNERISDRLNAWLAINLWGIPVSDIPRLLNRTHPNFSLHVPDEYSNAVITPCCRAALKGAIGNALRNAESPRNRVAGTEIITRIILPADEDDGCLVLVVANRIADATGLWHRIARGEISARGLELIQADIEAMNRLSGTGAGQWSFLFSVWNSGTIVRDKRALLEAPWRIGELPEKLANGGQKPLTDEELQQGDWAVALFVMPKCRIDL